MHRLRQINARQYHVITRLGFGFQIATLLCAITIFIVTSVQLARYGSYYRVFRDPSRGVWTTTAFMFVCASFSTFVPVVYFVVYWIYPWVTGERRYELRRVRAVPSKRTRTAPRSHGTYPAEGNETARIEEPGCEHGGGMDTQHGVPQRKLTSAHHSSAGQRGRRGPQEQPQRTSVLCVNPEDEEEDEVGQALSSPNEDSVSTAAGTGVSVRSGTSPPHSLPESNDRMTSNASHDKNEHVCHFSSEGSPCHHRSSHPGSPTYGARNAVQNPLVSPPSVDLKAGLAEHKSKDCNDSTPIIEGEEFVPSQMCSPSTDTLEAASPSPPHAGASRVVAQVSGGTAGMPGQPSQTATHPTSTLAPGHASITVNPSSPSSSPQAAESTETAGDEMEMTVISGSAVAPKSKPHLFGHFLPQHALPWWFPSTRGPKDTTKDTTGPSVACEAGAPCDASRGATELTPFANRSLSTYMRYATTSPAAFANGGAQPPAGIATPRHGMGGSFSFLPTGLVPISPGSEYFVPCCVAPSSAPYCSQEEGEGGQIRDPSSRTPLGPGAPLLVPGREYTEAERKHALVTAAGAGNALQSLSDAERRALLTNAPVYKMQLTRMRINGPTFRVLQFMYYLLNVVSLLLIFVFALFGGLATSFASLTEVMTMNEGWESIFYSTGAPQRYFVTAPYGVAPSIADSFIEHAYEWTSEYYLSPTMNNRVCKLQLRGQCSGGRHLCNATSFASAEEAFYEFCPYCPKDQATIATFTRTCTERYYLSSSYPVAFFVLGGVAVFCALMDLIFAAQLYGREIIPFLSYDEHTVLTMVYTSAEQMRARRQRRHGQIQDAGTSTTNGVSADCSVAHTMTTLGTAAGTTTSTSGKATSRVSSVLRRAGSRRASLRQAPSAARSPARDHLARTDSPGGEDAAAAHAPKPQRERPEGDQTAMRSPVSFTSFPRVDSEQATLGGSEHEAATVRRHGALLPSLKRSHLPSKTAHPAEHAAAAAATETRNWPKEGRREGSSSPPKTAAANPHGEEAVVVFTPRRTSPTASPGAPRSPPGVTGASQSLADEEGGRANLHLTSVRSAPPSASAPPAAGATANRPERWKPKRKPTSFDYFTTGLPSPAAAPMRPGVFLNGAGTTHHPGSFHLLQRPSSPSSPQQQQQQQPPPPSSSSRSLSLQSSQSRSQGRPHRRVPSQHSLHQCAGRSPISSSRSLSSQASGLPSNESSMYPDDRSATSAGVAGVGGKDPVRVAFVGLEGDAAAAQTSQGSPAPSDHATPSPPFGSRITRKDTGGPLSESVHTHRYRSGCDTFGLPHGGSGALNSQASEGVFSPHSRTLSTSSLLSELFEGEEVA